MLTQSISYFPDVTILKVYQDAIREACTNPEIPQTPIEERSIASCHALMGLMPFHAGVVAMHVQGEWPYNEPARVYTKWLEVGKPFEDIITRFCKLMTEMRDEYHAQFVDAEFTANKAEGWREQRAMEMYDMFLKTMRMEGSALNKRKKIQYRIADLISLGINAFANNKPSKTYFIKAFNLVNHWKHIRYKDASVESRARFEEDSKRLLHILNACIANCVVD